jgi:aryl carrier-like protein
MVIADGSEIHVQMTLRPHSDSDGRQGYAVEISRILEQERELCVTARLAFGDRLAADTLGISEIAPAGDFPAPTDGASFYRDVWAPGEDTGTMFRRIRQVWRKAHHAVADIVACEAEAGEALTAPIIEAGFQCLHAGSAIESATERNVRRRLWVPYAIDRVAYRRPNTPLKWCRAIHHPELRSENAAVATITLYDGAGDPALEVAGFHLRPLHEQALRQGKRDDGVYRNVLDRANLAPVDRGGVAGQLVLAIDAAVGTHDERNALCKGFPGEPVVLPLDDPAACAAMLDGSLHCRRLSVAFIAPGGADGIDLRPAGRLLELARILAERGADIKAFAVCTLWHDDVPSPAAAAIEGLARVMMNEYPDWGVRLVSHEMSAASAERARQICTEISLGEAGEQVVYRDGERYRRTLLPFALPRRGARLRGDRSYLVVGESDEQIGLLAKWLSENGAGRVEIAEFGDMGQDLLDAEVRPVGRRLSADASGLAKRLVEREGSCPIAGVFFLPWGTSDESLELKSLEGLVAEAADCLDFLTALASACETVPLDHFVCFSSSAAVLGTRGQGSYAALTSAIDALCADRRRRGLAGLSVNWGPWLDVGRWTRSAAAVRAVSRQGWTLLDPVEALSLMGRAMAGEEPVVSVIRVRWGLLAGSGAIDGIRLLAGATSSGAKGPEPDVGRSATDEMAELIGEQLGETPGSTLLVELGLDSLMAVKLRNTLKRTHGVDIPLAHLLAKTTLSDLAELDARRNAAKKVGSTAVMNVGGGAA